MANNEDTNIPLSVIKLIPTFSGDTRVLSFFLKKCEFVLRRYQGDAARNAFLLELLTSKLDGKAAAVVSEIVTFANYEEFKTLLIQHFGDARNEECVAIDLESMKIKPQEPYIEFCNRVQDMRSLLLSKVRLRHEGQPEIITAKKIIYDNTALNVFLFNLPEHMVRTVRLKNPNNLEAALTMVLEEVNFQDQYNTRSKYYHQKPSANTPQISNTPYRLAGALLPTRPQPVYPPGQFKFGIPNAIRALPPLMNTPPRALGSSSHQNKVPFNFRPNQNFAFRPHQQFSGFRPYQQLQGRPYPQMAFRPPNQQGYTHQPRPFQTQPQYSNDVSMRTAPSLPKPANVPVHTVDYTQDFAFCDEQGDAWMYNAEFDINIPFNEPSVGEFPEPGYPPIEQDVVDYTSQQPRSPDSTPVTSDSAPNANNTSNNQCENFCLLWNSDNPK